MCIRSFVYLYVNVFVHPFVYLLVCERVCASVRLFTCERVVIRENVISLTVSDFDSPSGLMVLAWLDTLKALK